jgi:hypothetical protein
VASFGCLDLVVVRKKQIRKNKKDVSNPGTQRQRRPSSAYSARSAVNQTFSRSLNR